MKKYSRPPRQNAVLLTSASTLVMLAGCDFTDMKNPFTPDRPPQVVEGERRQPIYNQQMISRMQAKAPGDGMLVAPAGQAGNPLPPAPPAAMAPAVLPAQAPVAPPPAAFVPAAPAPRPAEPSAAMPAPVQAASAAQEGSFLSRVFTARPAAESGNLPPWKMRGGVQPDYVAPEAAAAPAWADQWIGKPAPQGNVNPQAMIAPQIDAPMDAERNAPYPSLSSVPPRPEEFETAKTAGRQALQELQDARAAAEATRDALSAQPSQTYQAVPVEMPPPPEPPAAGEASAPSYPSAYPSAYPGAPRRGVDIMTQEEWEALKRRPPSADPVPAMDAPQQRSGLDRPVDVLARLPVSSVATEAASAAEPPSFFARVFGSPDTEHADTNTPSAIASVLFETADGGSLTAPAPQPAAAADEPRPAAFPTAPQTLDAQLALLSAPPLTEDVAEAESGEDWLLALVSRSRESIAPEAEESAAPGQQLLARMTAPPAFPDNAVSSQKSIPSGGQSLLQEQAQKEKIAPAPRSAAPAEPLQLSLLEMPPADPAASERAGAEASAPAEPQAPAWLSHLFLAHAGGDEPVKPRQVMFGTQLATAAAPESVAPPPSAPGPLTLPVAESRPASAPPQLVQDEAAPAPAVNRAIAERLARLETQREAAKALPVKKSAMSKASAGGSAPAAKNAAPVTLAAQKSAVPASVSGLPEAPAPAAEAPAQAAPETLASISTSLSAPVSVLPEPVIPAAAAATPDDPAGPAWYGRLFGGAHVAQHSADAVEDTHGNTGRSAGEEETKLPSLASVAAPIADVLTGEAALAAGGASALPSPRILQEVKMLPASRYSARVRGVALQDTH